MSMSINSEQLHGYFLHADNLNKLNYLSLIYFFAILENGLALSAFLNF